MLRACLGVEGGCVSVWVHMCVLRLCSCVLCLCVCVSVLRACLGVGGGRASVCVCACMDACEGGCAFVLCVWQECAPEIHGQNTPTHTHRRFLSAHRSVVRAHFLQSNHENSFAKKGISMHLNRNHAYIPACDSTICESEHGRNRLFAKKGKVCAGSKNHARPHIPICDSSLSIRLLCERVFRSPTPDLASDVHHDGGEVVVVYGLIEF